MCRCILSVTLWLLPCVLGPEGKECPAPPALEEWRVCNDHPCTVFYWEVSAWGPCIEDTSMDVNGTNVWNGTSSCAAGFQIRKVICMKMNAGPVVSKRWVFWPGISLYYFIWGLCLKINLFTKEKMDLGKNKLFIMFKV